MTTPIKTFASQSGHYYRRDGTPCYEVPNASKGGMRPTTVRDAKSLNLVPSFSTVDKVWDAPGLRKYFDRMMWEGTHTTPRPEGESDDDYFARCCAAAKEHSEAARDAGTDFHGEMEKWIKGESCTLPVLCQKVYDTLVKVGIDLRAGNTERSFAHVDGFGGRIDWYNETTVLDFKSKAKFKRDKKGNPDKMGYDNNVRQLACYAYGLGILSPRCVNVFVELGEPQDVMIVEWDANDIARGLRSFKRALEEWQDRNDIAPNKTIEQKLDEAGL